MFWMLNLSVERIVVVKMTILAFDDNGREFFYSCGMLAGHLSSSAPMDFV